MPLAWAEPENQAERPCYVLAPVYTNQSGTDNQKATTAQAVKLIEKMIARGLVDKNRVYVMGKSMGGSNTQRAYMDYPGLFSAAMPLAGGIAAEYLQASPNNTQPTPEYVDALKGRPFYIIHSDGDSSTARSDNLYSAIRAAGATDTLVYKRYSQDELAVEAGDGISVKPHDVEILCMEDQNLMNLLYNQTVCTVTFDSDGGTLVPAQYLAKGMKAVEPDDPQKGGYKFEGWYIDSELYDFKEPVNSNIGLTAKYAADTSILPPLDTDDNITRIDFNDNWLRHKARARPRMVLWLVYLGRHRLHRRADSIQRISRRRLELRPRRFGRVPERRILRL